MCTESVICYIRTYGLGDVVYDNGAVCVAVVHWRKRLVSLLACRVPDFELDGRVFVKRERLCEEGGANGRLAILVELVLLATVNTCSS